MMKCTQDFGYPTFRFTHTDVWVVSYTEFSRIIHIQSICVVRRSAALRPEKMMCT